MAEDIDKPQEKIFRTVFRSARFSREEWVAVQERAVVAGLSPARFLRDVALGTSIGRRVNAEAVVTLNRTGVLLINCVRVATRNDQPLLAAEARKVLALLRERLSSFL